MGRLMMAEALPIEQVVSLIGRSLNMVKTWGHQDLRHGIDRLNTFNYQAKQTYLTPKQIAQLVVWVKETNPATTKQVRAYIHTQFRVSYTVEAVRQLLHQQGLKRLRPTKQPGDPPSEAEQRPFVQPDETMKGASAPGTVFVFGDAMHVVHQPEPGSCWGDPKHPPVSKTNSGRKRLNILGAYNPATHTLVHVTGEETCDAMRVLAWLETIENASISAPKIVVFVDHAKYFNATVVAAWVQEHPRLQLDALPTDAPNVNLIERLGKFAKEKLVKNTSYERYKTFRAQVFRFLNHVEDSLEALKTLMGEKFQIIQPNAA